jgi:pyruvate/2-oxoglutarate dehydrogenase complex dihydrolipoamide acyltransferase (E2) component
MAIPVAMPRVGQTMSEGTVLSWEKKVGELVKKGEVLVRIETDISELDVVAEVEGYLLRIDADPEQIVPCGETIAWLGEKGEKV